MTQCKLDSNGLPEVDLSQYDAEFVTYTDEDGIDLSEGTLVKVPVAEEEGEAWPYNFDGIVIATHNGKVVVSEQWVSAPNIALVSPGRLKAIG